MATITGLTAAAMQAIRDGVIVDADVVGGHLILTKHDATTFDAGVVTGPMPDMQAHSVTSLVLSNGATKVLDLDTPMNAPFPVGAFIRIGGVSPLNFMVGIVTASTVNQVTITSLSTSGTGTFADWTLTYGALEGISQSAIVLLIRGGANQFDLGNLTGAVALNVAHNSVTMLAANMNNGVFKCTLTGNTTFDTATTPAVGTAPLKFTMKIFQDATGSRTLTLTGFKKPGGALVLGTTANLYSIVEFFWDGIAWNATLVGINYA